MSWLLLLAAQADIPEGTTVRAVSLDSDGRTIAWVGESGDGLLINGKNYGRFDEWSPHFGPLGHWAVVADDRVIHDGVVDPVYQRVWGVQFSPDGTRLAYLASDYRVVIDGVAGDRHDWILHLSFLRDGRLFYITQDSGEMMARVDEESWGTYDTVDAICTGADGSVAFFGRRDGVSRVVLDGAKFTRPRARCVREIALRPDGIALIEQDDDWKYTVVTADRSFKKVVRTPEEADVSKLGYLEDGRLCYQTGKSLVVGDERIRLEHDYWQVRAVNGGLKLAYWKKEWDDYGIAADGRAWYRTWGRLAVGDVVSPEYEVVTPLEFTSDGAHYAYRARPGKGEWQLIVDNEPVGPCFAFRWIDDRTVRYVALEKRSLVLKTRQVK